MSESDTTLLAKVHYYYREHYYHHVESIASEALKKYVNDAALSFYRAVAILLGGRPNEAINELEELQKLPEFAVGSILAQLYAYKISKSSDNEMVQELESRLREERQNAGDKGNYYAGLFCFFTSRYDRAKEFVDKTVKLSPKSPEALCLKGWTEMFAGRDLKLALKCFEDAQQIVSNQKYPDVWLGKSKYSELRGNYSSALEELNQGVAQMPSFMPLLIEKMKLQLMTREWEQCIETAQKCQVIDPNCIQAVQYLALNAICREGQYAEGASLLTELLQIIDKCEQKNAQLYVTNGRLFSRICGRNPAVLRQCKVLVERALLMASDEAYVITELANQQVLSGQTKQALKTFKQAIQQQEGSIDALLGIVQCQILDGEIAEALSQIDLIKAVQPEAEKTTEMVYLQILLDKRQNLGRAELIRRLNDVINQHFTSLGAKPLGPEYYIHLNPDFVMEIGKDLFAMAPSEPSKTVQLSDPILKDIIRVLAVVIDACPGHTEALYLSGKAKYLSGETDSAQSALQACLDKDPTYSEAHLFMAQLYLQQQKYKQASQSLEVGLSFNFEVRDHPAYNLIKARIFKMSNNIDGAIQLLQNAISLPAFKKGGAKKFNKLELTENDRLSVYLELIDCYQTIGDQAQATKLLQEAAVEFHGTKESHRLVLSNADLALTRGDVERALSLLKSVSADQPDYLEARQKMADIYLHHKKDKRQFALCYKELVEKNPSPQAFIMLGDAYMSIQEPERAIELYEQAMKKNPKDHALAKKIGKAYVKSHNYSKAVNYYEAALKTGHSNFMRYDLAELLFKLRNFEKCERVLKQGLEKQIAGDVQSMVDEVRFLVLLSKLYFETGNWEGAVNVLMQAKENQTKVLKRGGGELADSYAEQRKLAASICTQLGQFYENRREMDKAVSYYKEALQFVPSDSKVMLALARLYLNSGDINNCDLQCQNLLRIDKDNDQATLMLADLMYQRNQSEAANVHFQQLLERNSNQYHALARVVELAWRTGDLDMAEKYIHRAAESSPRATLDPGFNFCKGLHEWYTGDPNSALQHFNRARRDLEWGERAIYNMIEICLNPDNEIIGGEVFERGEAVDAATNTDRQDAKEMGVKTAERFLKELRFKPGLDYKYRLMENFILISAKNRQNIEQALANLAQMAGDENEEAANVGAVLGMARGYMMLKQTSKAKAQLKRVVGHPWNFEDAEYLEQCWLLLADTYINQAKYDVATEILKTCLQHNASCLKALEFLGFIREKEQKWVEAATNYECAWKLTKKRNPTLGYKLAFNYLKSRRYVDAIDTCHRVLNLYPNYPKIRRDILDKARASLRM